MTVHERLSKIQGELLTGALTPDMARESLVQLTALLGNANAESLDAEMDFKAVFAEFRQLFEAANRAKVEAEATPQYRAMKAAKNMCDEIVEAIRTCKVYLRSLDEEMRLSR